MLMTDVPT